MAQQEYYVKRLYGFLRRLAANNDREWFKAHKGEYDELRALWLADIDRLILLMGEWNPALRGQTAKGCAYRIYRDTRFSPDKRPLKDYFSAGFSPNGRKAHSAGYYLQMGPGRFEETTIESGLYGGVWCPDAPTLNKLRHAIVDNIEEFEEIVHAPAMEREFPGWCATSALKTVPKGWDRNHPQAPLLRLRDFGKFHPCDENFFSGPEWVERASELFAVLHPLVEFLRYSIEEE
ncbi:MAG: DUF2461 domain-containing protein [Muribaculaceae bacterium]|nr:DUF2461 domain-containing protein [Muribaculaceae bacterium]